MSGSNPNYRFYTARTAAASGSGQFHSAEDGHASGSGATSGSGTSAGSVSLAPPAWAVHLFGGAAARKDKNDDLAQQRSLELDAVESLRESSVVVRPMAPPLANAAATPRLGAATGSAASPLQQQLAARRYAAEMAATFRPVVPPPGSPPAAVLPLKDAYCLSGQPPAAPGASYGYQGARPAAQKLPELVFDEQGEPTAPPPGRFGWFRNQQPAAPAAAVLSAVAAVDSLPADTWHGDSSLSDLSGMSAGGILPLPPSFCAPSVASMHRFPTSQQQLMPEEAGAYSVRQGEEGSCGKPSPSKSIDASVFHMDAYAGAMAAVESMAARVGGDSQLAGQRPSRTAALRQRHMRQLRQQDRDQFGVPVASSARPFSLWASPQKIGEACIGLGVYFASVKQFVVAALLLSLVAIYPLVSNSVSQSWSDAYVLKVDQAPLQSCNKGWDTSSWVTGTTAGSRCSSSTFSSSFDCLAVCIWSSARLSSNPECAGLPPPSLPPGAHSSNATCLLYPPCSSSSGSGDPSAPDGPCYCCDLQLDSSFQSGRTGTVPAEQLWVLFLGQMLFLLWVLFLTRSQLHAVHTADARVITASDYTAVIHGVPGMVADAELREWCSHYGAVVATYAIPDAGDAIYVAQHLQMLLVRHAESDAWLSSGSCACSSWWFNLCALGVTSRARLQHQLEATAHMLRCYERQDLRPTGTVLAVFEYAEHAANLVEDHHRPAIRRALDAVLCGATATTPRLASKRVRVRRAPEPSDILWQHTACTGSVAFTRRLASAGLTLLIVAAGAGVQYGLAVAGEDERKNKMSTLYSYDSQVDGSLNFSSWAAFTASALEVTKLNAISILSGLAVVLVNWLVTVAVRKLTVLERWHTRTAGERWALFKLSVAYLTNAFVVPLLAAHFAGSSSSWYSRGGLMESAFWMQVASAVLPPLAVLCDPEEFLYFYLVSRHAKTQAMMNRLLEPPPFLLAEQYASAVTTLGVAACWMPVLPISPNIALLGLLLAYWADKIVALRRAAHPGNMRGKLVSSASLLIRLLPLVQLLLMRFLYFRDESAMVAVFWAGLAVWLLFAVAPLRMVLGLVPRRRSTVTGGLSFQETLGRGQRQGQDDHYEPEMLPCCSPVYQQQVAAVFEPLPTPQPANKTLLPRQNPALGGAATRQPFRPDKQADRIVARAAASLRARQHITLSIATNISGRQGSGGLRSAEQPQPGSSRLVRGLSSLADSMADGASWLWNTPNPDDTLFSYDWRKASEDGAPRSARSARTAPINNASQQQQGQQQRQQQSQKPPGMSPFQPMGRALGGREWSGGGAGGSGSGPHAA